MTTVLKHFDDLSLSELYGIMNIRQEVFIVEQTCPYLDADYKDQDCHHYYYRSEDDQIFAYVRLVPPGVSYKGYSSIGRVVVAQDLRDQKWGVKLMKDAIKHCQELYRDHPIKISGQRYLEGFYTHLGFRSVGEPYLEDDIPHIAMIYAV